MSLVSMHCAVREGSRGGGISDEKNRMPYVSCRIEGEGEIAVEIMGCSSLPH